MFVEALLIGILVGFIRKGRLSNLSELQIRGWILVVIGAFVQFVPILLNKFDLLKEYHVYFPFGALVLMIGVLLFNLEKRGAWMILIGGIMNAVAIGLNGFKMPISLSGLQFSGLDAIAETIVDKSVINYIDVNAVENFTRYLGKIIAIPSLYPFAKVLSVGDVFVMLGIILLISGQMTNSYFRRHGQQLRYSYKPKY
jgi:uncharacterized membrane protein